MSKHVKNTSANGLSLSLIGRQLQHENAIVTTIPKRIDYIHRLVRTAIVDEAQIDARLAVRRAGKLVG